MLLDKHGEEVGEFLEWKEDEQEAKLNEGLSCLLIGHEYLNEKKQSPRL